MDKRLIQWLVWLSVMTTALIIVALFSLCVGAVKIPLNQILHPSNEITSSILFKIRLPRIILGFAVGGALSLSGVVLQGLFRNPLVEPYTLGISGGAALGVSLNIALHIYRIASVVSLPLSGFIGALAVILILYSLSMRRGILKMQGLLLTGVMISFISSSLIMLIMAVSRVEDLHGIVFWIMGSLGESDWSLVKLMGIASIIGLFLSYFFALDLNALSLGEEEALHLGINVERSKRLLFVLASVLTGLCVSSAGIIGFVGLVVPHFVRMFVGEDHRILLVASFLCGAAFLVLCDTLARTVIAPLELPVGVITGILGGALFVYALTKREVSIGEG